VTAAALTLAGLGVAGLLVGALMPGAQPVLANYVPVIDHPVFFAGLIAGSPARPLLRRRAGDPGPHRRQGARARRVIALRAAAAANVLALLTFAGAWRTTPAAAPHGVLRAPFLGRRPRPAGGRMSPPCWRCGCSCGTAGRPGAAVARPTVAALMTALVLPQVVMPGLAFTGTTETAYFTMATHLMRWTLFPVVLVVLGTAVVPSGGSRDGSPGVTFRFAGLAGSAALTLLGFILGR
jgi:cytochrome c oxidase subunit 1